ncbi:Crp/Fnr family transcriptional regulator [Serratia sp. S1B]|nr:Crp/Fnr family transcriptional regulator [Serratia sp. S1B]
MQYNQNRIIILLPLKDRLHLLSVCEQVELTLGQVMCESGVPMFHAYFPNGGSIALLAAIDKHAGLSVGMVGQEGMLGMHLMYGIANAPQQGLVQGAGVAWRIDHGTFLNQVMHSTALQRILGHYTYVAMAQLALLIGCQRFHVLDARLARWLLMRHDRTQSDSFPVTHESLGYMLGVRRVGVTVAAGVFQTQGLIRYNRGTLTVLDRRGLEHAACSCYEKDHSLYMKFMSSTTNVRT